VRILRVFEKNTSDVRILFLPLTNFCRLCQIKSHDVDDADDGEDEFCDGERV
jgi:hypothetical protein